jgi:type IV secretory pathway TraG/TraD family ATPase VirD4
MRNFLLAICLAVLLGALILIPGAMDLDHNSLLLWLYSVLCAPGIGVIWLLRALLHWLGANWPQNPPYWFEVSEVLFIGVFSYVFWQTSLSRLFFFIGLWNPFSDDRKKPRTARVVTKLRDWWEVLTKFGRQSTGGWAPFLEVLSNRHVSGDIFLGRPRFRIGGGMLRPIGFPTEKHMVTIAGTGAGKSTGALIPNLCIHEGSVLCVDPKGELAKITATRRGAGGGGVSGMGQDVYVLDPFSITGIPSACYNVFDEMARTAERDIDAPIAYAAKVAEALVVSSSRDPYWDNAAREVIKGLVLYVFQGPPGKRNLMQMRRLLMVGDKDAFEAGVRDGSIDPKRNDAFDALLLGMKNAPDGPYQEAISYAASTILRMPENQRGSVLSIAQTHTAFLDLPEIKRVSLTSDFVLADLKSRYLSVYLSLPLNMVSGPARGWLRMFVLLLIDMMFRNAAPQAHPLLLAIDEFPSLGKLDGIELVAPTLRSFGVRLWVVGQDIEQFQATYPDSWGGFLGNAEAVQFLGIKHIETVDMIVKFLGRHVVETWERDGKARRKVRSERNLLDANQVSQLLLNSRGNQIVWRGDRRPLLLKTTQYFKYMPYWYYAPDRRFRESANRTFWRWLHRQFRPPTRNNVPPEKALAPPFVPPKLPPPPGPPNLMTTRKPDDKNPPKPPANENSTNTVQPPNLSDLFGSPQDRLRGLLREFTPTDPRVTLTGWKPPAPLIEGYKPPVAEIIPPTRPPSGLPPEVLNRLNPPKVSELVTNPLDELEAMIGLEAVKQQVQKTLNLILADKARKQAGLPTVKVSHHLVFTGNPGTGKTTVARIVGKIYQKHGLLKSGHVVETDRSGLVAGYLGQTGPQVEAVVTRALDGILFVDEAYSLAAKSGRDDYGAEAIATLLKLMEDKRDRLVVIAAGYKAEMESFINSNPGLSSRFKTYIDFPDYTPEEQMEILQSFCVASKLQMSMDAMLKAADTLMGLDHGKNFGNGRTIRNMFEECLARQANRLADRGQYGAVDLAMIEAADIPEPADIRG